LKLLLISKYSDGFQNQSEKIQKFLKERSRKSLGWKTPAEKIKDV